jgi:hypothetical protein
MKYNFPEFVYKNVSYEHWRFIRHWGSSNESYYGKYMNDYAPIYTP